MPAARFLLARAWIISGLALVLTALGGCKAATVPAEDSRPSKLAIYYGRYMSQNKGAPPPSEIAFKKFIKSIDADSNVDELFISPRDKEPYVVRYDAKPGAPGALAITVHEKTGVSGQRIVGLTTGQVKTVDEAEFKELLSKSK